MSSSFIADLEVFVYADELIRAVGHVIGVRPKSKAVAKVQLQSFLAKAPAELEQHLKALLGELLAEDLNRWSKERLGTRMNKSKAVSELAAWYSARSSPQSIAETPSSVLATTRSMDEQAVRRVARYFEGEKTTTRDDYLKIEIGRTRGELRVMGPCPSCGASQQFGDAAKRQVGTVVKVLGGLFSQPVKTIAQLFSSAECMEMSCSKCAFGVSICGQCDQVNRHEVDKCSWCGNAML